MKLNQWTLGLAAAGVISLASVAGAEEATSQVLTALSSTTLSGYVDTSAIWKFGTGNQLVGRAFDGTAKQDGFNLNVVKLTLEKPLDEGQWSAGYKADLLFGPDASLFNQVIGNGSQDVGIKQAYVVLRAPVGNGIDIKMGVFDTIIGYEVFEAGNNPNYSRSYGWQLEPTQHTGVLASYRVADFMSVAAGVANTWNAGINGRPVRSGGVPAAESEKTYMASVTLSAPESFGAVKGAALYGGVVNGLNNASGASGSSIVGCDTTSIYAGVTIPLPLTGLAVGAAYDYRSTCNLATPLFDPETGIRTSGEKASTYANAVSAYVTYQHEKWKFANRSEYTSASNGTWYTQAGPNPHNELFGNTTTVDYSLWANVITRLEFRWDHDLGARRPDYGGTAPFGIDDKNAISLALNVIYKF
jgi:hypothetical protein